MNTHITYNTSYTNPLTLPTLYFANRKLLVVLCFWLLEKIESSIETLECRIENIIFAICHFLIDSY